MKRKTLIPLSLSFLLAAATAGVTIGLAAANKGNQEAAPSTFVDEVENDNLGAKLAIRKNLAEEGEANVINAFGYQLVNKTETAYSIRVFGVLDGYKALSSLKVTSKVTSGNEVVKADQTFELDYVYSSIASDIKVTWVNERPTTPYYAVYTLNNIPASHAFDDVKVTFTANNDETKKQEFVVNAEGVAGAPEYFDFGIVDEEAATYFVTTNSKQPSGKVFVPSFKANYENGYATKVGDVVALGDPSNRYSSGAAFASKYSVEEVVIPEGVTSIGDYTFYSSSYITKLNIPSTLVSMGTSIGYSSYSLKTLDELDYNAVALVNDSASFLYSAKVVKVSAGVTSLPNKFFSNDSVVEKVIYEGTTAQWKALKTEANKNNGFFIDNVICSDTQYATITLHLGEATLGEHTGDYVARDGDFIIGNVYANPGKPVMAGMQFKGWKTNPNAEGFYDFSAEIEGDLDLYPVFEEPGPGISLANPFVIGPTTGNFTAELFPGKKYEYLRFDMPENEDARWIYLGYDGENSEIDAEASVDVSRIDESYVLISAIENVEGETQIAKAGDTSNNAGILNTNTYQNDQSASRGLRFYAEPGQSYYFKAALYEYSYYPNRVAYGTMGFSLHTYEHDGKNNAINVELGANNAVVWQKSYQHVVYKYVATADDSYVMNMNRNSTWTNVTIVDEANPTVKVLDKSSTANETYGVSFEAGHTYYIDIYSNYNYREGMDVSFAFTAVPDGYDQNHAILLAADGTPVAVENVFGKGSYFKVVIDQAKSLNFSITGAVSTYPVRITVTDVNGTQLATAAAANEGTYYDQSYASTLEKEVSFEPGTYYVTVGYNTSSTMDYTNLKIAASVVQGGTTKITALPIEIGSTTEVNVVTDGIFYKFTAAEEGFVKVNLAGVEGAIVSADVDNGNDTFSARIGDRKGEFLMNVEKGKTYVLMLKGAEGTGTLTVETATENTGKTFDTAIAFVRAQDGWMDLTNFASGNTYRRAFVSFTTGEAGVYRIYSTGFRNMDFKGLYKDADTSFANEDYLYKANSDDAHPITNKTGFYVEIELEANTTYAADIEIPGGNAANLTSPFKFGVDLLTPGASYSNAIEKDFSGESVTLAATEDGTWYKFTAPAQKKDLSISATLGEGSSIAFYQGSVGTTANATLNAETNNVLLALEANQVVYAFAKGAAADIVLSLSSEEHIDYFAFSSPTTAPTDNGTDTVCYWKNTHDDATGTYSSSAYYNSCKHQFEVAITDQIVSGVMSCRIKVNNVSTSSKKVSFSVYKKVEGELVPIEGWSELESVDDGTYQFNVNGGDVLVFEYRIHGSYISSTVNAWVDSFAMGSVVRS